MMNDMTYVSYLMMKEASVMSDKKSKSEGVSVYYNSACPLCNAGVNYQKSRMKNCPVRWNDVHEDTESISELGSDLEFVRKRLHVKNSAGEVVIGIDAFIALWELSPGDSWKVQIMKLPVIHGIAIRFYNSFAWILYRWNKMMRNW
ncbi:MAG: putative DCC family thiol-disulfide oxidoreductase YuxK [Oleiphilaceae bacterium]|jgi:predicted DCC family thiol-disulfide oxidoreductase YuxK